MYDKLFAPQISRRDFLSRSATIAALLALPRRSILSAKEQSDKFHDRLIITEIEVHDILVPYEDWIAYELNHFYGPTRRTIYVVHTNRGLIGLKKVSFITNIIILIVLYLVYFIYLLT